MKKCPYCNKENIDFASFCAQCGKNISSVLPTDSSKHNKVSKKLCPKCRHVNHSFAVYCAKCGADLRAAKKLDVSSADVKKVKERSSEFVGELKKGNKKAIAIAAVFLVFCIAIGSAVHSHNENKRAAQEAVNQGLVQAYQYANDSLMNNGYSGGSSGSELSTRGTTVQDYSCSECLGTRSCIYCKDGYVLNGYLVDQKHKCSYCRGTGVCQKCKNQYR